MRADAKRNYDRIVETAREVFREKGYDAPLDEIAKKAGVGPGTLYRHFPNRDALLDAMMQIWVDRVDVATEKTLAREGEAREVLLAWFEDYVGLVSSYKGSPAKITSAMGDPESPIRTKCQVLSAANAKVIEQLGDAVKPGLEPVQLARLIGGVATVADQADLSADAVRPLLEVVADGVLR
ncbi:TetR/AcrR family transcriptional regulator [Nocardioides montaniterrae]